MTPCLALFGREAKGHRTGIDSSEIRNVQNRTSSYIEFTQRPQYILIKCWLDQAWRTTMYGGQRVATIRQGCSVVTPGLGLWRLS